MSASLDFQIERGSLEAREKALLSEFLVPLGPTPLLTGGHVGAGFSRQHTLLPYRSGDRRSLLFVSSPGSRRGRRRGRCRSGAAELGLDLADSGFDLSELRLEADEGGC